MLKPFFAHHARIAALASGATTGYQKELAELYAAEFKDIKDASEAGKTWAAAITAASNIDTPLDDPALLYTLSHMPPPGGFIHVRRRFCDAVGERLPKGTDEGLADFELYSPNDVSPLLRSPPAFTSPLHAGYRYDILPHLEASPPAEYEEVVGLSTFYHLKGDATAHLIYLRTDHHRFRRQQRHMPFVGPRPPKSTSGLPDYSAAVRTLGRMQVEIIAWLAHGVHKASEVHVNITPDSVAGQDIPAWNGPPSKVPLPLNEQSDLEAPHVTFSAMGQFFESFGCKPAEFTFRWSNETNKRPRYVPRGHWYLQTSVNLRQFRTHLIGMSHYMNLLTADTIA